MGQRCGRCCGLAGDSCAQSELAPSFALPPAVTVHAASKKTLEVDCEAEPVVQLQYSGDLETDVTAWIEAVSGEKKGSESLATWLKDGQVLCKLANGIKPGTVKKINAQPMPFKQMENITFFTNAAREFGVHESAMFATPDLYEEKNIGSVVNCIYTLGGAIQTHVPNFTGPEFGVAMVQIDDKKRFSGICTDQAAGFSKTMEVQRPMERADYVVKPVQRTSLVVPKKSDDGCPRSPRMSGASAASGKRPRSPRPAGAPQSPRPSWGAVGPRPSDAASPTSQRPSLGGGAGPDAKPTQPGPGLENEVTLWIEAITGDFKGDQTFADWLKNGQVLCVLVNAFRPGIVTRVNTSNLPFKQMENITFFMNAARELGVPESSMLGTAQLYEEKDLGAVAKCIYMLGGAVQVSCPNFEGPKLGVALKVEHKDVKRNSICTDQMAGLHGAMEQHRPTELAKPPSDTTKRYLGRV